MLKTILFIAAAPIAVVWFIICNGEIFVPLMDFIKDVFSSDKKDD